VDEKRFAFIWLSATPTAGGKPIQPFQKTYGNLV
jgi:hypothetical protein